MLGVHQSQRHPGDGAVGRIRDPGGRDVSVVGKHAQGFVYIGQVYGFGARTIAIHGHQAPFHALMRGCPGGQENAGINQRHRQEPDPEFYFCLSHFQRSLKVDFLPNMRIPTL